MAKGYWKAHQHPRQILASNAIIDWRLQDTTLGKIHGVCSERIRQLRKAAGLPASGSAEWLAAGGVIQAAKGHADTPASTATGQ